MNKMSTDGINISYYDEDDTEWKALPSGYEMESDLVNAINQPTQVSITYPVAHFGLLATFDSAWIAENWRVVITSEDYDESDLDADEDACVILWQGRFKRVEHIESRAVLVCYDLLWFAMRQIIEEADNVVETVYIESITDDDTIVCETTRGGGVSPAWDAHEHDNRGVLIDNEDNSSGDTIYPSFTWNSEGGGSPSTVGSAAAVFLPALLNIFNTNSAHIAIMPMEE